MGNANVDCSNSLSGLTLLRFTLLFSLAVVLFQLKLMNQTSPHFYLMQNDKYVTNQPPVFSKSCISDRATTVTTDSINKSTWHDYIRL